MSASIEFIYLQLSLFHGVMIATSCYGLTRNMFGLGSFEWAISWDDLCYELLLVCFVTCMYVSFIFSNNAYNKVKQLRKNKIILIATKTINYAGLCMRFKTPKQTFLCPDRTKSLWELSCPENDNSTFWMQGNRCSLIGTTDPWRMNTYYWICTTEYILLNTFYWNTYCWIYVLQNTY